jgi:hypothetical protein
LIFFKITHADFNIAFKRLLHIIVALFSFY